MAGHSKWANIKRRKGAQDQARGKLFTKLIKEIAVAAKVAGPDPSANPRLRLAIDKARSNSLPKSTIERAIAKASGDKSGSDYESLTYEGYGPGGVAILVEALTDNRNRTSSEVRHAFTKHGGSLGASGSVAYMFQKKGVFAVAKASIDEDDLTMAVLEADGDDVIAEDDEWIVTCAADAYEACKAAVKESGADLLRAELSMIPDNVVPIAGDSAGTVVKLLEWLEDLDDVQETWSNADFPDE